jgi:hypothetical protein
MLNKDMDYRKAGFWTLLTLVLLLNPLVQALHEAGHWAVYQALGCQPAWGFIGLVQVWGQPPLDPTQWVETVAPDGERGWLALRSQPSGAGEFAAAAGGPIASLLGMLGGVLLARFGKRPALQQTGLLLVLIGSFAGSMYYLRSPWRSGGDEYDMAAYLGVPKALVELLFGLLFVGGLIWGLRRLGDWRTMGRWMAAAFLGSVATGVVLTLLDGVVRAQFSLGNPLFQAMLGYSLPVLLVNGLVLVGVVLFTISILRNTSK